MQFSKLFLFVNCYHSFSRKISSLLSSSKLKLCFTTKYDFSSFAPLESPKFAWHHHQTLDTYAIYFNSFDFFSHSQKGICSYVTHGVAVALDSGLMASVIYIRNIFYGASLLLATILILDFLSFHPLFGPWAIIIGELLLDVGKFVVVLSLFMFGFALFFTSLNQPTEQEGVNPLLMFELLFFSMFGYAKAEDLIKSSQIEGWTTNLFKLIFASYLLLAVIVLINLLIGT